MLIVVVVRALTRAEAACIRLGIGLSDDLA